MSAFVLYASEWFRRDWGAETKGVWKPVMNGVARSAEQYWELNPAMATGLAWWNQSSVWIIRTQYLGPRTKAGRSEWPGIYARSAVRRRD